MDKIYIGFWSKIAPIETFQPIETLNVYLLRKFGKQKYEQEEWEHKDEQIKKNKAIEFISEWVENGKSKNLLPEYKIGTKEEIFNAYKKWQDKKVIVDYYLLNNGIGSLYTSFLVLLTNAIAIDKNHIGLLSFQNILTNLFIDTVLYTRTGGYKIEIKQQNEFNNGIVILRSHNDQLYRFWNELHLQMSLINPNHPLVKIYDNPENE